MAWRKDFQRKTQVMSGFESFDKFSGKERWTMKKIIVFMAFCFVLAQVFSVFAAGDSGTREEAVAMVKKAVECIKANGQEKAFSEFNDTKGKFVDRDLYIAVYDKTGKCVAHGANQKMIGRDLIDNKDVDGKEFIKERVEMMKAQKSAWQDYKFRNPVTNQIEPKTMYLESHEDLIIGCGVYNNQ